MCFLYWVVPKIYGFIWYWVIIRWCLRFIGFIWNWVFIIVVIKYFVLQVLFIQGNGGFICRGVLTQITAINSNSSEVGNETTKRTGICCLETIVCYSETIFRDILRAFEFLSHEPPRDSCTK